METLTRHIRRQVGNRLSLPLVGHFRHCHRGESGDAVGAKAATAALQTSIRRVLDPALSTAIRVVGPTSASTMTSTSLTEARQIREILRVVVRPLIDTLAASQPAVSLGATSADSQAPPAEIGERTIDIPDSIRPFLSVVPLAIIAFPFLLAMITLGPAVQATLLLTLTWPLLSAVRRLWPEPHRMVPVGRAVMTLTAVYIVTFGLPLLAVIFGSLPLLSPTMGARRIAILGLSTLIVFIAIAWFASSVIIFDRSRRRTEINEKIESPIARVRQEMWCTRRNLRWIIHGPLQSALVSAALHLESGNNLGPLERRQMQQRITDAYALLQAGGPQDLDFARFSAGLARMWSGICEIAFDDPDSMIGRLDKDPTAAASIIEIITESVSNAIRHGKATSVRVTICGGKIGRLALMVSDNGTGISVNPEPGTGSELFNSLAHRWYLTPSATGLTLRAEIPWIPRGLEPR